MQILFVSYGTGAHTFQERGIPVIDLGLPDANSIAASTVSVLRAEAAREGAKNAKKTNPLGTRVLSGESVYTAWEPCVMRVSIRANYMAGMNGINRIRDPLNVAAV